VFDCRITLAGDLSDRFHAGHSHHRLSLFADAGETPAQIVIDENTRAQRAIERAPAYRLLETFGLRAQPGAAPHRARLSEHDAALAHGEPHERLARRDPAATDARALRSAEAPRSRHSAVTCSPVSASASFWW